MKRARTRRKQLEDLSNDSLQVIFSYITPARLFSVFRLVCRRFNSITRGAFLNYLCQIHGVEFKIEKELVLATQEKEVGYYVTAEKELELFKRLYYKRVFKKMHDLVFRQTMMEGGSYGELRETDGSKNNKEAYKLLEGMRRKGIYKGFSKYTKKTHKVIFGWEPEVDDQEESQIVHSWFFKFKRKR